jgi:hypothetical protein
MNTTVASIAYWIQPALQIFINIWFAKIFIINLIPVSNKTQLVYVAKMILVIVKKNTADSLQYSENVGNLTLKLISPTPFWHVPWQRNNLTLFSLCISFCVLLACTSFFNV